MSWVTFTRVSSRMQVKIKPYEIEAVEETRTGCHVRTKSGASYEVEGKIDDIVEKIDKAPTYAGIDPRVHKVA